MVRPELDFDWRQIVDEQLDDPIISTRDRLRWLLALFALGTLVVLARAAWLEIVDGAAFRHLAAQPLTRELALPATRGKILARDGTVLAADRAGTGLAIHFRYLQEPSDPRWLRKMARARLKRAERRDPAKMATAEQAVRQELVALRDRLARECGVSAAVWQDRAARIEQRVTALAAHVNERRLAQFEEDAAESQDGEWSALGLLAGLFAPPEPLSPPPIEVAEQTAYHRLVDDVPIELATEIRARPAAYPGVKVVNYVARDYPQGTTAAQLVGYVGARAFNLTAEGAELERTRRADGASGIESRDNDTLRGRDGAATQFTDHRGKLLSTTVTSPARDGGDVWLAMDAELQRTAEQLLDQALRRVQDDRGGEPSRHGAALVVLDVHSGEVLAAASVPRFDPNWFAASDSIVERVLADPRRPMFDRVRMMALPPGSVFKPITAIALLQETSLDPSETFRCQGFLREPDRLRCQIYRHHGIGHGDVTLADALAQSCNVYFFHHASSLGSARLIDWASRFGFGQRSSQDDRGESPGQLPSADQASGASHVQLLSIGQGAITATPLQVALAYAAITNGGHRLVPRWTRSGKAPPPSAADVSAPEFSSTTHIAELRDGTLAVVRDSLRRTVNDPNGTAYESVRLGHLAIAGKTGTAETGAEQSDHAWFAGYVPAEAPRFAFAVVLEHGGEGTRAGAVIKHLVLRMQQLGYFGAAEIAETQVPPGKG